MAFSMRLAAASPSAAAVSSRRSGKSSVRVLAASADAATRTAAADTYVRKKVRTD